MIIVPIDSRKIQNQYDFFMVFFERIETVALKALGDASKVVSVVLNIVVKAAIAIIRYVQSPITFVYNPMSCCAKPPALELKFSPVSYIIKTPNDRKHSPKMMVKMYPILKSVILFFVLKSGVSFSWRNRLKQGPLPVCLVSIAFSCLPKRFYIFGATVLKEFLFNLKKPS